MIVKPALAEDYKRLFDETAGGPQVLEELITRFGRGVYVKGGVEGDRQTCFNAGQRAVLDFILGRINMANGVNDDVED
ncbi:TPA: hypothetical protein PXJ75_002877 [Yersinia enterocolitica]|nr:hypothetical protein [Yersinia enterocolitica]CQH34621.1 Uncharacterised protein [Yersinia enterocolitica]HDL6769231.1 hypothetical protein [Yersinia enterocolitica]HDL7723251.1 hypothetical protein [Yersinia enterocolitica]